MNFGKCQRISIVLHGKMRKVAVFVVLCCTIVYSLHTVRNFAPMRTHAVGKWGNRADTSFHSLLMSTEEAEEDDEFEPKKLGVEETTKKYGLEVGLLKSMRTNDGGEVKPGELLKKYGAAYLITSITLAIISYAICYFLVNAGVDVAALLKKVGIEVSSGATNAGTAGIAYVIHKAASPIRFPPTVALTPVVANIIGKEPNDEAK